MQTRHRICSIVLFVSILFFIGEYFLIRQIFERRLAPISYQSDISQHSFLLFVQAIHSLTLIKSGDEISQYLARDIVGRNWPQIQELPVSDGSKLNILWDKVLTSDIKIELNEVDIHNVTTANIMKWNNFLKVFLNISEHDTDKHLVSSEVIKTLAEIVRTMNKSRTRRKPLGEMLNIFVAPGNRTKDLSAWQAFQNHIRRHSLYSTSDPVFDELLHNMRSLPIIKILALPKRTGRQMEFVYMLADNTTILAKPQRYSIDKETPEDLYTFDDFERFHAEVAAFHLDRLLGFYRVPPVVSRYINMTSEIHDLVDNRTQKSFFYSPIGSTCFYKQCDKFCIRKLPICGHQDTMAMSFALHLLPSKDQPKITSYNNPWAGPHSLHDKPTWEGNDGYCRELINKDNTRRLLDLMDMSVFDFMLGNLDRGNFYTLNAFDNDTNIILNDNGKGFPRSYKDELTLLSPITQCCLIRLSTLDKLIQLYMDDIKLSTRMRQSLETEDVQPILTNDHLLALDRRLSLVLQTLYKCLVKTDMDYTTVIKDDGF